MPCQALLLCFLLASSCLSFGMHGSKAELPALINNALAQHQGGKLQEAISSYTRALNIIDATPDINGKLASTLASNLGAIYMSVEDYESSKQYFEKSINYDSASSSPYFNLAVLLTSKMDLHSEALTYAIKALKLDPANHKALHICGNIMQALGREADANRYFIKAEQLALQAAGGITASSVSAAALPAFVNRLSGAAVGDLIHSNAGQETRCLSARPLIFRVSNLLSASECEQIISRTSSSLEKSFVMGGDSSDKTYRSSSSAWLAHLSDPLLQRVLADLAESTSLPLRYIQQRSEELQVVRYDSGGEFKMHHDSSAFHPRLLTLLVYLTDVPAGGGGETSFPFAASSEGQELASVEEAIERSGALDEGSQLRVAPRRGDAVLFFNHLLADGFPVDPAAVHAGLPVREGFEKVVANFWIELDVAALSE